MNRSLITGAVALLAAYLLSACGNVKEIIKPAEAPKEVKRINVVFSGAKDGENSEEINKALIQALAGEPRLFLVEKEKMLRHVEEHLAGTTDCKDPECYGLKGKIPAAKYSIIASSGKLGKTYFIISKLIDLNNGSSIAFCRKETGSKDELTGKTLANAIVKELADKLITIKEEIK